MAPDNTGYLMGCFVNVITGVKLPLFPYAITDNTNKAISYEKISSNHIQNSQRRHLCACACYSFGDAYELWADVEVKDLDQPKEEPPENNNVVRTPTKPNQEPDKDYLIPKAINPIENSVFVISIKSKRIGVFTMNILKVSVAKNPCEKVA